jgi:hypothetical protein
VIAQSRNLETGQEVIFCMVYLHISHRVPTSTKHESWDIKAFDELHTLDDEGVSNCLIKKVEEK